MVLETYIIEKLFVCVRQRQSQYSIESATKNVPATTHQPTGISRLQSSRVQSHMSRSGRPSGIPVKTAPNNSLRQGKVNQPAQLEGAAEGTSKSLNNMVVSDATSLQILPFIVLNTGLFISPSGISELNCATTKTDMAERSISIGRESLPSFFCTRGLGVLPGSTARG